MVAVFLFLLLRFSSTVFIYMDHITIKRTSEKTITFQIFSTTIRYVENLSKTLVDFDNDDTK